MEGRTRQLVEVVGLAAVVVSLLLVAYQNYQANRIARATTTYELVRDINWLNDVSATDPEFSDFIVALTKKDFAPSETQAQQADALAFRLLNNWVIQEEAFRNGLLTDDQFSLSKDDVRTNVPGLPGLLPFWKRALENYPGYADYEILEPLVQDIAE